MLVGRLCNAGVAVRELQEAFGHDPRTVKRWGAALLSGDIEVIARVFAGRSGQRKLSPELIRYARQLYRERHLMGRNYREVIIGKIADVFAVHISTTTASGLFSSFDDESGGRKCCAGEATGLQNEADSRTKADASVKHSPTPLPAQTGSATGETTMIHHAGQALFAEGMSRFEDPLQRQFLAQILQGAVNVEQSKTLCGRSLANFTGPITTRLKAQRDGLDAQAEREAVMRVYGPMSLPGRRATEAADGMTMPRQSPSVGHWPRTAAGTCVRPRFGARRAGGAATGRSGAFLCGWPVKSASASNCRSSPPTRTWTSRTLSGLCCDAGCRRTTSSIWTSTSASTN
jgi:hypothetical protein